MKKSLRDAETVINTYRAIPAGTTIDRTDFCNKVGNSQNIDFWG